MHHVVKRRLALSFLATQLASKLSRSLSQKKAIQRVPVIVPVAKRALANGDANGHAHFCPLTSKYPERRVMRLFLAHPVFGCRAGERAASWRGRNASQ